MAFMNRLVGALRRSFQVGSRELVVTTSVGIALAPADGDSAATALRHASIALARAKGDGGQRMCFFEQSMDKALPYCADGEWVLRRACRDALKWPEPWKVAVNLSPAQFRDGDIAETVAEVLRDTGLPPSRLELEITENLLINDTEEVLSKLSRLRELGVDIAMDDFGTGYSSLTLPASRSPRSRSTASSSAT
jgi:predicted signal transduction protein with EAL and GGDEF domain